MKKAVLTFFAAIALGAGFGTTRAQDTISPEKLALVNELLTVAGTRDQMREWVVDPMLNNHQTRAKKAIGSVFDGDTDISSADKTVAEQAAIQAAKNTSNKLRKLLTDEFGRLMDDTLGPVFANNFTESELQDLIAFYRSPTGQKAVKMGPKLVADAAIAFVEKLTLRLEEITQKTIDEETTALKKQFHPKKTARKS